MPAMTIRKLLQDQAKNLDMSILVGEAGLDRTFNSPEMNRPGLAFAGFYDVFSHDRIQIIGLTEISFLKSLDQEEMRQRLRRAFEFPVPCLIITTNQVAPPVLLDICARQNVPVLVTPLPTSQFWGKLSFYLEHEFAPRKVEHASMLDVFGMGVLIRGKSGIGKSECALELIERGHRLVADDVVLLRRLGRQLIVGTTAAPVAHHMEVRGIGIVDVEKLFGVGSVIDEKRVSLVVQLERWEEGKIYERTGLDEQVFVVLEVPLPEYVIPIEPGRNISLLVEVAALTQRLRHQGRNPATELNKRLIERIRHKKPDSGDAFRAEQATPFVDYISPQDIGPER